MKILIIIALAGLLAGCGDPNYHEPCDSPKTVVFPVYTSAR